LSVLRLRLQWMVTSILETCATKRESVTASAYLILWESTDLPALH